MFPSIKEKRRSYIVFGIYFVLLVWLVLFKFATSLSELPSNRGINWIPFHYEQETSGHLKEVLFNILAFIPLGVYLEIFKENWKTKAKCMVALLTSFLFEAVQFVFSIGVSDITDILGNTFGAIAGIFFCVAMRKIAPRRFISVINVLGIWIEIAAVGLLVLLLLANH